MHSKEFSFELITQDDKARLGKIINHEFTQKLFGDMYEIKPNISKSIYKIYIDSLCKILRSIGVNINTVPVLDVLRKSTNKIIGNYLAFKNDIWLKII